MEWFSGFIRRFGLATLWFAIALLFAVLAAQQLLLMLAPEGSEEWEHSEWAPAALMFCVAVGAPFALAGVALIKRWPWRRFWQVAPALIAAVLVWAVAR